MSAATIAATILRRMAKVLLWSIGSLAGLVVVFFVTVIAVNAFDENLSPEAQALVAPGPQPAITEANGYIEFLGFNAPEGQSMREFGLKVLHAYWEQDQSESSKTADNKLAAVLGGAEKVFDKDAWWCRPEAENCLAKSATDAALPEFLRKYARGLDRYRAIRDKAEYSQLYVGARRNSEIPSFVGLTSGQLISFLDIALKLNAGKLDAAIAELERETVFHFRMAIGSRGLIDKMVVSFLLARDALFISDVLREKHAALVPYRARIAKMFEAPSPRVFSLDETVRNLARQFVASTSHPDWSAEYPEQAPAWLVFLRKFAYQPNATANLLAEGYRFQNDLSRVPVVTFDAAVANEKKRARSRDALGWHWIVNLGGKLYGSFDYSINMAYMYDTAALLRLVSLQLALYEHEAPDVKEVAAWLAVAKDKSFANPYTEEPMDFDAKSNTLSFEPRGRGGWIDQLKKRFDGRIAVAL